MAICLERSADLHVIQLMPLPLTVSCSSKIQTGFTFLVPAHPGSHGQRAVKRVCVCVCLHIMRITRKAVILSKLLYVSPACGVYPMQQISNILKHL